MGIYPIFYGFDLDAQPKFSADRGQMLEPKTAVSGKDAGSDSPYSHYEIVQQSNPRFGVGFYPMY